MVATIEQRVTHAVAAGHCGPSGQLAIVISRDAKTRAVAGLRLELTRGRDTYVAAFDTAMLRVASPFLSARPDDITFFIDRTPSVMKVADDSINLALVWEREYSTSYVHVQLARVCVDSSLVSTPQACGSLARVDPQPQN